MPVIHGRTISEIDLSIDLVCKHEPNQRWVGFGGIVPLLHINWYRAKLLDLAQKFLSRWHLKKFGEHFQNLGFMRLARVAQERFLQYLHSELILPIQLAGDRRPALGPYLSPSKAKGR